MKKLLVTGASGFLGWNICMKLKNAWDITGTFSSHPVHIEGVTIRHVDLTRSRDVKRIFEETKPDAVIHTAAVASPDYCQTHRSESYKINVNAAVTVAGLCADRAIPLAFTSTDLVFDGRRGMYSEEDPVNPVNVYGEQKALAEQNVLETYPDAAVCRMPLMLGLPSPAYNSTLQSMVTALKDGSELTLFIDEFRSPVSAGTAASGLMIALTNVHGVIHLGGRDRISRYDLGVMLADILNFDPSTIRAYRQKDIAFPAPRAADVSLDSSKAFALGFDPMPIRKELEGLVRQESL